MAMIAASDAARPGYGVSNVEERAALESRIRALREAGDKERRSRSRGRPHSTSGLLLAVVLVASSACRQIVGFEEPASTPSPDAGADSGSNETDRACGLPFGTSRCAECVATSCCPEAEACAADPACRRFTECTGSCASDPSCTTQCELNFHPGKSIHDPRLVACVATQCESECDLTCGATAATAPPEAAAECLSCVVAKDGCETLRACAAEVDCVGLERCLSGCRAFDCREACVTAHEVGTALVASLGVTLIGRCGNACASGADFTCVGRVSWSEPKSETVKLNVEVVDYTTLSAVADAEISVCGRADADCSDPKAHAVTDALGRASLTFENADMLQFSGLNGYLQVTSPETVPLLHYWGFPLSEPSYALANTTFLRVPVLVVTPNEQAMFQAGLGLEPDPSAGTVVAVVTDCQAAGAPGVEVAIAPEDPATRVGYGLSPTNRATDVNAFAVFSPVPPGSIELVATPLALGAPSSQQSGILVRAGWQTTVAMMPTP